uniref:Uncharacterized protein n=1 Tax=Arundo donax TaxID=35708 RepID=A0A0A9GMH5_ARUDO
MGLPTCSFWVIKLMEVYLPTSQIAIRLTSSFSRICFWED